MKNMKPTVGIAALVVCWYIGDAIYPNWDWSCKARSVGGFSVESEAPEGLGGDHRRAVNPDRPEGCTLRADNWLRRTFDWVVL